MSPELLVHIISLGISALIAYFIMMIKIEMGKVQLENQKLHNELSEALVKLTSSLDSHMNKDDIVQSNIDRRLDIIENRIFKNFQ
jgi:hypothetical protein